MKAFLFAGQGSQEKGMGQNLFSIFPDEIKIAESILGYSLTRLCLEDPLDQLGQTQFTQPALFVVNSLAYLKALQDGESKPDFLAGHSLGEYCALFAADVFDFETGVTLVKKRGELMAHARGGGMLAVVGLELDVLKSVLKSNGLESIDIANLNSPQQTVLSGQESDVLNAQPIIEKAGARMCVPLKVSGAFHSRYMLNARNEFSKFLDRFEFRQPKIPVISNFTARPYQADSIKNLLAEQITGSVQWVDTIRYLMGKNVQKYQEFAPVKTVLKLAEATKKQSTPLIVEEKIEKGELSRKDELPARKQSSFESSQFQLGSKKFLKDFELKYPYAVGGMGHGISSSQLVIKLAQKGMLAFLGTKGLSLQSIQEEIQLASRALNDKVFGVNVTHDPNQESNDDLLIDLIQKSGVKLIEVSGFMSMTKSLVVFKANGISTGQNRSKNKIFAKVMRPEVAELFLQPAPVRILSQLKSEGLIDENQFSILQNLPMAEAICVEGDSAGLTEQRNLTSLLPSILSLRKTLSKSNPSIANVFIGASGGIGTPEAAAAAFVLGADFVLTGSINQCTVEAKTSESVKNLLESINVQDTTYIPSLELFELGGKAQVLKKGILFPARANKLYDLYRSHQSFESIDELTRQQIEERYFRKSFTEIFNEISSDWNSIQKQQIENSPKAKMAQVFKWYLNRGMRLAVDGEESEKMDFQVYCSSALGAFNQWYSSIHKGWKDRHVDEIGHDLIESTTSLLQERWKEWSVLSAV